MAEGSGNVGMETDPDALSDGKIAGIVIGSLLGSALLIGLLLYALKIWMQGPTKGSDANVTLENKIVVITGKFKI